jgi:hypothetical protein
LNDFWLSYGPLIISFFFCVLPDTQKLVRTTPHKLLVQFYPNITGIISTKSSCALSVCLSVRLSQNLSQHEIGHHEATHVITDSSCLYYRTDSSRPTRRPVWTQLAALTIVAILQLDWGDITVVLRTVD